MNPPPRIVPFDRKYERGSFCCGNTDIDDWLKTQARQHERKHNTRTFLAVSEDDRVLGYYALRAYQLDRDDVAAAYGAGDARYPMPAVLLARLGVDRQVQGQAIGRHLLADALRRIASTSTNVGIEVIVTHAYDQQAATFYARNGFTSFVTKPLYLFMPMKTLVNTVKATNTIFPDLS